MTLFGKFIIIGDLNYIKGIQHKKVDVYKVKGKKCIAPYLEIVATQNNLELCKYLYNNRNNVKSIKLFVISVLLGSVHYNTTFVFPTIIILYLTIGYVSSRTQLIKNNYIAGAFNG